MYFCKTCAYEWVESSDHCPRCGSFKIIKPYKQKFSILMNIWDYFSFYDLLPTMLTVADFLPIFKNLIEKAHEHFMREVSFHEIYRVTY